MSSSYIAQFNDPRDKRELDQVAINMGPLPDPTAARAQLEKAVARITEIAKKVGIAPPTSQSQVVFVTAPDKTVPIVYPPNFLPFKDSKLPAAVAMYHEFYTALSKAGGKFPIVLTQMLDKATAADKELTRLSNQRNFTEYDKFLDILITTLKGMRGKSAPPSDLAAQFNAVVAAALAVDTKILLETCGSKAGMLQIAKLEEEKKARDETIGSLKSQIEGVNIKLSGEAQKLRQDIVSRNALLAAKKIEEVGALQKNAEAVKANAAAAFKATKLKLAAAAADAEKKEFLKGINTSLFAPNAKANATAKAESNTATYRYTALIPSEITYTKDGKWTNSKGEPVFELGEKEGVIQMIKVYDTSGASKLVDVLELPKQFQQVLNKRYSQYGGGTRKARHRRRQTRRH